MRSITLIITILINYFLLHSQEKSIHKVPKQVSIEYGYHNIIKSDFDNNSKNGLGLAFDYAWQLSGLDGQKPPAYISVPLGYSYFYKTDVDSQAVSMLNYGWTVRHYLKNRKNIHPFLGYSLLLTNLKFSKTEGSIFGHQTRFEFGIDLIKTKVDPYFKLEYSLTRFPEPGISSSKWVYFIGIKSGLRFDI